MKARTKFLVCAARCGTPLHPAAAAGGFDRHPGCEPPGRPAVERHLADVIPFPNLIRKAS